MMALSRADELAPLLTARMSSISRKEIFYVKSAFALSKSSVHIFVERVCVTYLEDCNFDRRVLP